MRGKQKEKWLAIDLRKAGASVKEIARKLDVSVGSVSKWVRAVKLTPKQIAKLEERRAHKNSYAAQVAGAKANIVKWDKVRAEWKEHGKALVKRDDNFRDACLLYWAEGTKARNMAKISNTDWRILAIFLRSMKKSFDVNRVAITLLFYENDLCRSWKQAVAFWKSKLGVRVESVRRRDNDTRVDSGKNRNKASHGVCEVSLFKSTRIVQAIYGGIDEIAVGA